MSPWSALLLGIIQGVAEWIPVSSQGFTALAYGWLEGASASDAIAVALWLHAGTGISAAVAMRRELRPLIRLSVENPGRTRPQASFLIISTLATAIIAIPLYLLLGKAADALGSTFMAIIGLGMIATAVALRGSTGSGRRGRDEARLRDAVLAGAAQGIAVIPGMSRTGLTLATLLGRGFGAQEAAMLSILMGIPASVGAALLAFIVADMTIGLGGVIAMVTAAAVGTAMIRVIVVWAGRIQFAPFVAAAGLAILVGAAVALLL